MATERQDPRLIEAIHHARQLQVGQILKQAQKDAEAIGDYLKNDNYHAYRTLTQTDPDALEKFATESPQIYQGLQEKAQQALKDLAARIYLPAVLSSLMQEVSGEYDHTHELDCDAAIYGIPSVNSSDDAKKTFRQGINQAHETGVHQLLDIIRGDKPVYRMSRTFVNKSDLDLTKNADGSEDYITESKIPFVEIVLRFKPGEEMPNVRLRINPPQG